MLSKNRLGLCSLLAKIDSGFVRYKNQLGFCNNHKNQFSLCSSLAKIDSIFIPCKNQLDFYNMHKNRIGSLMD